MVLGANTLLKRCIYPDFCLEELGEALLIEQQKTFLGHHVSIVLAPLWLSPRHSQLPVSESLNQKSTPTAAEPSREEENHLL